MKIKSIIKKFGIFLAALFISLPFVANAGECGDGVVESPNSDGVLEVCDKRAGIAANQVCSEDCLQINDSRALDLVKRAAGLCQRFEPRLADWEAEFSDVANFPGITAKDTGVRATVLARIQERNDAAGPVATSFVKWCVDMANADETNFAATTAIHQNLDQSLRIEFVEVVVGLAKNVEVNYRKIIEAETLAAVVLDDRIDFNGFTIPVGVPANADLAAINTELAASITAMNDSLTLANTEMPKDATFATMVANDFSAAQAALNLSNVKLQSTSSHIGTAERSYNSATRRIRDKMDLAALENFSTVGVTSLEYVNRIYPSRRAYVERTRNSGVAKIDRLLASLSKAYTTMTVPPPDPGLPFQVNNIAAVINKIGPAAGQLQAQLTAIRVPLVPALKFHEQVEPRFTALANTGTEGTFLPLANTIIAFNEKVLKKLELDAIMAKINDNAKKTALSAAPYSVDFTSFEGVNYNAEALAVNLPQFNALKTTVQGAATNVIAALPNERMARMQTLRASISVYSDALSTESRKVSRLQNVWYKIINFAANAGTLDPALFGTDTRAAKIADDFNVRRDDFHVKTDAIADKRIAEITTQQNIINTLTDVPAPIDFATKSNTVITFLNDFKTAAGNIDNYTGLRQFVNDLKKAVINPVYLPAMRTYRQINEKYQKIVLLETLSAYLDTRAAALNSATADLNYNAMVAQIQNDANGMIADIANVKTDIGTVVTELGTFLNSVDDNWDADPLNDIDEKVLIASYKDVNKSYNDVSREVSSLVSQSRKILSNILKAEREEPQP